MAPSGVVGLVLEPSADNEIYAEADADEKFVQNFVKAWNKVMMLDRFDV